MPTRMRPWTTLVSLEMSVAVPDMYRNGTPSAQVKEDVPS